MLASGGKGDVEDGSRALGVIEEQLEKVAHPVEQQGAWRLGLERKVLLHHRSRFAVRFGRGRGGHLHSVTKLEPIRQGAG
ncbi:MAG: hypothetical protein AAFO28_04205 [Pseudomonadota bacterium]